MSAGEMLHTGKFCAHTSFNKLEGTLHVTNLNMCLSD